MGSRLRARRIVAAAVPVAAVAFAWARLERAPRVLEVSLVAALGLAAVLPRALRWALAVGGLTTLGVVVVASSHAPGSASAALPDGLRDFYTAALPFDAGRHPGMHALVLVAVAAFGAAIAIAAPRLPLAATAFAAVGVVWPATIAPGRDTIAMGALALAASLWPLVTMSAPAPRAAVPGVATLLAVVVVASATASGARPQDTVLDWQHWDPFSGSNVAHDITLVWDASYTGIEFPARKTTVLRIAAPRRALFWRASTLDVFVDDRWIEALYPIALSGPDRTLPGDPLLPAKARVAGGWVRQDVEVAALVDGHLVGAAQPVQVAAAGADQVLYLSGGVMRIPHGLTRGQRYTVWSYAPRPSPASLVRSPPRYPAVLARYLQLGRPTAPPFGRAGRTAAVEALFRDQRYQPLWAYRGVWRAAQRVTAGARSPYEATVEIERWLRSDGGFTYEERPPAPVGLPPLADFVERTKQGYCQQFAGTMALMLRMLGIPARVAVGFTSGTWEKGRWTVTDHDAHAWVEAWFAGYGWLTFDPTPGRGTLSATYTNASDSADAIRALGTGRFLDFSGQSQGTAPVRPAPRPAAAETPSTWPFAIPLVLLALALGALATAKAWRRRARYGTRDPRVLASAARSELTGYLRDQGIPLAPDAPVGRLAAELTRLGIASDGFRRAFARARYGPLPGADAAAADARRESRRLVGRLRQRLGLGRRLRGFFALRSLRHP